MKKALSKIKDFFHQKVGVPNMVLTSIPFILIHLSCFAVIFTGYSWQTFWLCMILYFVRMWAVTAGYHRYFSHRSYDTSRIFQFILAILAQTSAQQGILWWADNHRKHHKYSDTELDLHSPRQKGFWYAHIGWIFTGEDSTYKYDMVKDLEKFPELVWLDRHKYMPAAILGFLVWLFFGWQGLVGGFCISTILVYHCTFFINSLTHVLGSQRFITADDSRNNFWLALITLGEGWHNNHHYFAPSTRQGFYWWEIDITYYLIKILSWFGIVWGIKEPPKSILFKESQRMSERTAKRAGDMIEKAVNLPPKLAELAQELKYLTIEHIQLLDIYRREVILEVFKEESRRLSQVQPKVLAAIQKMLVRQQSIKELPGDLLNSLKETSPKLYNVYNLRVKLQKIWEKSKNIQEQKNLFQEWRQQALSSGIDALAKFTNLYLAS